MVGCREKPAEVEIEETRRVTALDKPPRLFPTSEERFEGGRRVTGSVRGTTPEGWQRAEGSSMRLLNFVVGPEGEGEVYLSKSRGGVPANAARWLRQFGVSDASGEALAALPRQILGGLEGVLVEAEGTYAPGMGRPEKPGQALVGVIAEQEGVIWTLKMTGPKAVVAAEREKFLEFCQALELPE